jgi:transcription elongation factor GreB
VGLGSKVELEDLDEGDSHEYEIVVPEEVDGAHYKISLSSPLGKSLIGKGVDDDVEVHTPKGKRAYAIKKLTTIHTLLAQENGNSKR